MNVHKPIPFFVKWHSSKQADFMRKHSWFFEPLVFRSLSSPYLVLFCYIPACIAILLGNAVIATVVVFGTIFHMMFYTLILIATFTDPPKTQS